MSICLAGQVSLHRPFRLRDRSSRSIYYRVTGEESEGLVRLGLVVAIARRRSLFPVEVVRIRVNGGMTQSGLTWSVEVEGGGPGEEPVDMSPVQAEALDVLRSWLALTQHYTSEDWQEVSPLPRGLLLSVGRSEE